MNFIVIATLDSTKKFTGPIPSEIMARMEGSNVLQFTL